MNDQAKTPRPRLLSRAASKTRALLLAALFAVGGSTLAREAVAAPTAQGSSGPGGTYKTTNTGYQPPDFVYGGNAISFMAPFQIGLTPKGFVPRARLGFQYDRQLHRAHWVHVNAAALFDRGDWDTFKMDSCGLTEVGTCQAGTVAGMDLAVGYTHKLFIEKKPWIVPTFRAGLAGGFWSYPRLGGTREQTRELTWTLGVQLAAGMRFFLLRELAIGIDVEFRPGLAVHRERESGASESKNIAGFVLPIQVLPLIIEYRF